MKHDPQRDLALYLDTLYGKAEGYVHTGFGIRPYRNSEGCYKHGRWSERQNRWPVERGTILGNLLDSSEHSDVYICPYLLSGRDRHKGTAVVRLMVHADIDGDLDPAEVERLGGIAISSGSEGHGHVYLALAEAADPHQHEALCAALGAHLGYADAKISDNDLLRPPGTLNHKGRVDGGSPTPVEWAVRP